VDGWYDASVGESSADNKLEVAVVARPALKMRELLNARGAKGGKRGKGKVKANATVSAWLTLDVDVSSAANTAYTTAIGINPSATGNFSGYSFLYDEYKAVEAKFCFKNALLASPTGNATLAGIAYHELTNSGLGSVQQVCEAKQHILWAQSFNTATGTVIPQDVNEKGLYTFRIKIPEGAAIGSSLSQTGGIWTGTSVTGVNYGYMLPYLEAAGGTGVSRLRGILFIKVIFRCRG